MKHQDWKLFEPFELKGLKIKNRIVMLPMGNHLQSAIGEVTQKLVDYYAEVAEGGVGLIIVQAAYITGEFGGSRLRIDSDDFIPGLNELAETIKSKGARAGIQINHRGYFPSEGTSINDLDDAKIKKLIDAFGKAAARAKSADFDMVEIHGGHGYLIAQFLSGLTNQRGDGYGGNLERRMKFATQVYQRVREAVGEKFPVSYRMSGDEFLPGGISINESKKMAGMLHQEGVDLISITAGNNPDTREWIIQPMAFSRGCLTALAEEFKQSVGVPILVAGRINDPSLANSILEQGKGDLIGVGRGLIADSQFPNKAALGELDGIRRCIACNFCHGKRFARNLTLKCAVNPEAGRKKETSLIPTREKRKVVVIGGGPSGLECAHTLHQRGHEVLLFEKTSLLGGKLRVAAIPPHKEEINGFLDFLIQRAKRDRFPIFFNQELDSSKIRDIAPDALVLATGGIPIVPDISGLSMDFCCTAEKALAQDLQGQRILILGGGLVGCEVAEFLMEKGKEVAIIEKLPELGLDLEPITRKFLISRLLEKKPVIFTATEILRIEKGKAFLQKQQGEERVFPFDAIVFAVGFSPNDHLLPSLQPLGLELHSIGDCSMPRGIFEAIHEGNRVGRLI